MGRTAVPKGGETFEPQEVGIQGMSKRKSSDERRGDRAGKRPALQTKQHLYLLLDDWERGYSVRKVDVSNFDSDADTDLPPECFTEPPVARMEAVHEMSLNFVSHGTKIFAMQPGKTMPAIPAFDTRTLGLTICPRPSCQGEYMSPVFVSVAGKLFLFMNVLAEYLGDPPPDDSKTPWSWTTIKARPPFFTTQVICHVLHPDGRTLFVSAGSRQRNRNPSQEQGQGTFSFDAVRLQWTHHGDWLLPFTGQAYFDAELESWVGLCGERDGTGCLCSCDVVPVAAEFTSAPSWKLGEDRLFRKGPQLHLGVKLAYMGDSKFCLVESLTHKDDEHLLRDPWDEVDPHYALPRRRVVRMTTFGLKYNWNGELRTTLQRASTCKMYEQPHDFGETLGPLAFWL